MGMSAYTSRIQQILDELENALHGVAAFATKKTFQEQNATYGEAYLKPAYQLGTALLASKEILLIVADFPEVQVRNIRVAERRIARSGGRLQKGVAVIAHRDPTGNTRLRAWGREVGLTILPLDYSDAPPTGEPLLDLLLEDLYSYDRFDLTGPVRSEFQFFGRPFIPDLARRLTEGTIHALFGMRKVGKTSLLNRVLEELKERHGCRTVMLDASDDSLSSLDAASLLGATAAAAANANSHQGSYSTVVAEESGGSTTPAAEAQNLLSAVNAVDRPLVLFIDELDYITPSSPIAPQWRSEFNPFFRALRRAYQESTRGGPVFSIVLSGVSSRWFTEETVDGVENAALALVPEGYLPPLDRSESTEMIETLGRACGLIFDQQASEQIAATASDNPFWIRKLGSFINSCYDLDRPLRPELVNVRQLCMEFVEVEGSQLAYSSLRHLFRIYPDLGFAAVAASEGRADKVGEDLLSFLGRYGIIDGEADASGPMIAEGIRRWKREDSQEVRQLPFDERRSDTSPIEPGSPSSAGEEEWAEMLSEVSLRRNVEERRLRELILIVVRSECAAQGAQKKPADVLRAALPASRREYNESLGASQLMRTLYWSDLLQVVRKNWRWFEQLFADRSKFDMWGEIVNDRPDAHAKDLDGAELALQRRAIDWFARAIDRSELL